MTQACPNGQKDIETKRLLIDIEKGMDSADSIVFEEVGLAGRTPMNAHSTGYSCNRTIHAAKLPTLLFADMPLPSARVRLSFAVTAVLSGCEFARFALLCFGGGRMLMLVRWRTRLSATRRAT